MSKRKCKWLCTLMSVVLLLTIPAWAGAMVSAESTVMPRYSYTGYTYTALTITSGGTAYCTADVEGYDNITTKIHINMKLQQYLAMQWTTIGEWEGTFNDIYGILDKTKTLTSSGRYRVKAVFTVYSGSAYETITSYSQEQYYTYTT